LSFGGVGVVKDDMNTKTRYLYTSKFQEKDLTNSEPGQSNKCTVRGSERPRLYGGLEEHPI